MFKSQKGITLVALVITIIVMLILAGVSIAFVVGEDGVLSKAQMVEEEQVEAAFKEAVALANSEFIMDYYADKAEYKGKFVDTETGNAYILSKINNNYSYKDVYNVNIDLTSGKATIDVKGTILTIQLNPEIDNDGAIVHPIKLNY